MKHPFLLFVLLIVFTGGYSQPETIGQLNFAQECAEKKLNGEAGFHSFNSPSSDLSDSSGFIEVPERIRVALVLGSGGGRGIAHIGVIEELVNAGIPIDLIVGCSSGSAVGALYANNPDVEALKSTAWKVQTSHLFDFDFWRCRYGLYQGESLREMIRGELSVETFDKLQIPLVVAATDLMTGELVSLGEGDIASAIQASCSIPLIFSPCEINGRILIDGGVINPVPVAIAEDLGAEVIIAVDLSEHLPDGIPNNFVEVFMRSAEILFLWQNEMCARPADIVIRPRTTGIGTFSDHLKFHLYTAGKTATQERIRDIQSLLESRGLDQAPPSNSKRCVKLPVYNPAFEK